MNASQLVQLRESFLSSKNLGQFITVFNGLGLTLYERAFIPFSLNELMGLASQKEYQSFLVPKKSGGHRVIYKPNDRLNQALTVLSVLLQVCYKRHPAVYGFVPGVSIVDNAKRHLGQKYIFNIDLKDFFFSFNHKSVRDLMLTRPFDFTKERASIANLLADLVVLSVGNHSSNSFLPQGSPSSPVLTNFLCKNIDIKLFSLAENNDAIYTRYADDITFSSNNKEFANLHFNKEISRVMKESNFEINRKKTRFQGPGDRKMVTGLVLSDKVNVRKGFIKKIKKWLYICKRYSSGFAQEKWIVENPYKSPNVLISLEGMISYLRMVRGAEDSLVQNLQAQLDAVKKKFK